MIRLWCEQADEQTFRIRFTGRNIAVTGVFAITLAFSKEPGTQANAVAKVCPGPALERILRFPQISSCTIKTFPDSTNQIDSAVSPARSTKAPFGKFLFSALRQLDAIGVKKVYAMMPSTEGVGLAVYNRLLRAAAFRVVNL